MSSTYIPRSAEIMKADGEGLQCGEVPCLYRSFLLRCRNLRPARFRILCLVYCVQLLGIASWSMEPFRKSMYWSGAWSCSTTKCTPTRLNFDNSSTMVGFDSYLPTIDSSHQPLGDNSTLLDSCVRACCMLHDCTYNATCKPLPRRDPYDLLYEKTAHSRPRVDSNLIFVSQVT